ncbi:MAG: OadG family protein [Ruminococcus sp.]|nr:OadG family protein [Ruminococcus sp.]MDE6848286.1 OadG family protein [Ruminococcus sp.]
MNIGDAAITAVFGYAVVFAGLLILMAVLYCMGAFFKSREAKSADGKSKISVQTEAKPEPVQEIEKPVAKGSAGHIKLYDVPDKEAAMIMAIVADTMKKPINELHFISIKEVK